MSIEPMILHHSGSFELFGSLPLLVAAGILAMICFASLTKAGNSQRQRARVRSRKN